MTDQTDQPSPGKPDGGGVSRRSLFRAAGVGAGSGSGGKGAMGISSGSSSRTPPPAGWGSEGTRKVWSQWLHLVSCPAFSSGTTSIF